MKDENITKEQLMQELAKLRQRVAEIENEPKRAWKEARETRRYAESIIETVREPLVVLDAGLKVLSANRSFYNIFKVI